MDRFIAGLLAVVLGVLAVRADGINIPAPSWTYAITSLGTGVATALGINVGSAGGPVTNGGALGTPSSGVATNLTGTASGLTAGNVTTNANLTGNVTSVGNATTLAAGSASNLDSGTLAAARLPFNSATLAGATPSNPTGTTSTSGVMMGLGSTCTITPAVSTRILVIFVFGISNTTLNDGAFANLRTGTGTAPVNGAAATGTQRVQSTGPTALLGGQVSPMSQSVVVTGLTPATAYWLDLAVGATIGGTAAITNITCSAVEI